MSSPAYCAVGSAAKYIIVDRTRYGCAGWRYRGKSVCNNTIMASRKLIETLLLQAIREDLFTPEGFAIYKDEALKYAAARQQAQGPEDDRARRQLEKVEQEITNIMTAIKAGILTPTTKAELEKAERERDRVQSVLKAKTTKVDNLAVLLPNLKERFANVMAQLTTLLTSQNM
jgi:site-specific DNA recombinase